MATPVSLLQRDSKNSMLSSSSESNLPLDDELPRLDSMFDFREKQASYYINFPYIDDHNMVCVSQYDYSHFKDESIAVTKKTNSVYVALFKLLKDHWNKSNSFWYRSLIVPDSHNVLLLCRYNRTGDPVIDDFDIVRLKSGGESITIFDFYLAWNVLLHRRSQYKDNERNNRFDPNTGIFNTMPVNQQEFDIAVSGLFKEFWNIFWRPMGIDTVEAWKHVRKWVIEMGSAEKIISDSEETLNLTWKDIGENLDKRFPMQDLEFKQYF